VPTWGVTIEEAESVEQVLKGVAVWTNAKPSFFKVVRVSPAMTAEDAMRVVMWIQNQKPLNLPSFLCAI